MPRDLERFWRTTQNLRRFEYGPRPASLVQVANAGYAPLASPVFTGDPQAPTSPPGDSDTSIATTAFVAAAPNKPITLSGDVTGTGTATIPTALPNVNSNVGTFQGLTVNGKGLVTGATNQNYLTVGSASTTYAPLASPAFTGNPTAPTPTAGDSDTSIATTAFVATSYATIASPVFTGDPRAPTPATADNDTSIATTAYVQAQGYATSAAMATADNLRVLKAGDTMTGSLTASGLATRGASANLTFEARDAPGTDWFWYATAGGARLWRGGDKLYVGLGLMVGGPVGGDMGAGTVNAVAVYAGGVALTSDARAKRDVERLPEHCLDLVAAIEPKSFRHVAPPEPGPPGFFERRNWGFVAQEVKAAMDAAGHDFGGHVEDAQGNQYLSPSDLTAVLWQAVRELSAEVAELRVGWRRD